jgi:threonine synthase
MYSSLLSHLECAACGKNYPADKIYTISPCCSQSLLARYDLEKVFRKETIQRQDKTLWRYAELLPVIKPENRISLGEGYTPVIPLFNLGNSSGFSSLWIKDESNNPTGSFKARGLCVAVSKAKELGIDACIIPTAGNAGGALAAYCAKAGMRAIVVMPSHTPELFKDECRLYGAKLVLVNGLINDCAMKVKEINAGEEYFDVSTMKEPYRLEGKKTLGYEIAEQFNWVLPDTIFYPTGGGTGLIGMWKAFHEMIELGWIKNKLPRMVAVQAENCQPIVQTWIGAQPNARNYNGRSSVASGLAVPRPFAETIIMKTLKESKGVAIAVSDEEMIGGIKAISKYEGLYVAPEGGALWAAAQHLLATGWLQPDEKILLLNTGSGYKYHEAIRHFKIKEPALEKNS